jgi:hypothetical protein
MRSRARGVLHRLRTPSLLGALALAACVCAPAAHGEVGWQFAPAGSPPPPPGVAGGNYAVPLGRVGDISFWAPNRGLLITAGDPPAVPAGLYAYNGVDWHQLSTVCGGGEGRIVWAGPDEFWTISDERQFQLNGGGANEYTSVSLCHFLNGQVVGSYAEPFEQPDSYQKMTSGACLSASDCWFGGALGQAPNYGAFHLHWDGTNVSVVYASQDHAIVSMALASESTLLESVKLTEADSFEGEEPESPSLLHQVGGPDASNPFADLFLANSDCTSGFCPPLPDYGTDEEGHPVYPLTLGPFTLNSDYSPAQSNGGTAQLWALATRASELPVHMPSSKGLAHPIVLRDSAGAWSQVVGGKGNGGEDPFQFEGEEEAPDGIAVEPGSPSASAAWVTVEAGDLQAHVDQLTAEGKIAQRDVLGDAQGVGGRGNAGPIACPAADDCWLATDKGWLFHLTGDSEHPLQTDGYPEDTDPNFAGVITYRPPDPSVPQLPPIEPPVDDSLANQQIAPPVIAPPPPTQTSGGVTLAAIENVRSRLVHRYTLELRFQVTVKTRVQFIALRHGKVVARTRLETFPAGRRKLMLALDPRSWPTKINLKDTPLQPLIVSHPKTPSSSPTVAAPVKSNSVET